MNAGQIIREYDDLVVALRVRMGELNISFVTLDEISGVQSGYSAKVLGPSKRKTLGPVSFGAMLGALGLKLLIIEDLQALELVKTRLQQRNESQVRSHAERLSMWQRLGRNGGLKWVRNTTKAERRERARHAANVRWTDVKAAARAASAAGSLPSQAPDTCQNQCAGSGSGKAPMR